MFFLLILKLFFMGVKFLCCKEVLSDFEKNKKIKKPKDNSQQDNSLKSEIRLTGYSPEPGLAPTSRHDPHPWVQG